MNGEQKSYRRQITLAVSFDESKRIKALQAKKKVSYKEIFLAGLDKLSK